MKIRIARVDKSLPLPKYETPGAAGFDFVCRENAEVLPGSLALIPVNAIVEVPEGYMLAVLPRSSTPKKGLMLANSMGVIDNDYCGPEDEIKILVYNYTNSKIRISRGDRIAQGIFLKIAKGEFEESGANLKSSSRQGFGSTG
ncbi:MAG TPA: dUTP diphosphatase [bacterium]|nr:dUTP diphosphatase [bacterium]HPN30573.1 dUTP diphosphatase [bacterium]